VEASQSAYRLRCRNAVFLGERVEQHAHGLMVLVVAIADKQRTVKASLLAMSFPVGEMISRNYGNTNKLICQ
jgi:hypothetical protein